MKYIIVTDEAYYPTILVMDNEEHAKKIYEVLKSGTYIDWDGKEYKFTENFNAHMFCVEDSKLKTQAWGDIVGLPVTKGMVFL